MGDLMTAKKTSTKKTEETPDDSLLISVDVTFAVPFKQNEQHNRKPLDVLGIDATDLSDDANGGSHASSTRSLHFRTPISSRSALRGWSESFAGRLTITSRWAGR
jgi:hypothetical protein